MSRTTPTGEVARGKPLQGNLCGRQVRGSPLSQGLPLFENSPLDYFQIHPMRSSRCGGFRSCGSDKGALPPLSPCKPSSGGLDRPLCLVRLIVCDCFCFVWCLWFVCRILKAEIRPHQSEKSGYKTSSKSVSVKSISPFLPSTKVKDPTIDSEFIERSE